MRDDEAVPELETAALAAVDVELESVPPDPWLFIKDALYTKPTATTASVVKAKIIFSPGPTKVGNLSCVGGLGNI
jgi:hypothetical protein